MATIDDFGDTAEPLNNPPLGGPAGWAAAVRDAIKANATAVAQRLPLSGGTLTGPLGLTVATTGALAKLKAVDNAGTPGIQIVNNAENALMPLSIAPPTVGYHAATKEYVDARIRPTGSILQSGQNGGNGVSWQRVTFPTAFSAPPTVAATAAPGTAPGTAIPAVIIYGIDATGFYASIYNMASPNTPMPGETGFGWIAVGPVP